MPSTHTELESVLEDLRDVARRLEEVPEDAFEERLELIERRRSLRAKAAKLWHGSRTPQELVEELEQRIQELEAELARLEEG